MLDELPTRMAKAAAHPDDRVTTAFVPHRRGIVAHRLSYPRRWGFATRFARPRVVCPSGRLQRPRLSQTKTLMTSIKTTLPALLCLCLLNAPGCTYQAAHRRATREQLNEESRVLTTAVVDTLNAQPSSRRDAFTAVARTLATQDQRLEGLPVRPLDIRPLVVEVQAAALAATNNTNLSFAAGLSGPVGPATTTLERRFANQEQLLGQERQLAERLLALGEQAEAERNARIRRWTRWLSFGGLGIGGLIVLIVLVPAVIPILGQLLGWLVARLPKLAGLLGVVSVRAFDSVVRGVEQFKRGRARSAAESKPLLQQLSRSMDAEHKALVRQRRTRVS